MSRPYAAAGSFPFVNHRTVAELNCGCGAALGTSNTTGRCHSCAVKAKSFRPMPDDFAEHAATSTDRELMARYNAGQDKVRLWRRQSGVPHMPRVGSSLQLPPPQGFALIAPTMTMRQLRDHFGRSASTIRRWCFEENVSPRAAERNFTGGRINLPGPLKQTARQDMSVAGRAADFLRKFGAVYRCNASGGADAAGTHWRRGSAVLTGEDIIERAERLGFDPDAWKRLAA